MLRCGVSRVFGQSRRASVCLLIVSCLDARWSVGAIPAWAADAAPVATAPVGATPYDFISGTVQFFLMAFFVYFLLVLRPQQVKEDEQARFLRDLKKDDEVLTSGGLLGKVIAVGEGSVSVEIASGVRVRVVPQHLSPAPQLKGVVQESPQPGASGKLKGRRER